MAIQSNQHTMSAPCNKSAVQPSVMHLNEAQMNDINHALESWKTAGHSDGRSVSKETFPLPVLGPCLEDMARELHSGSGSGFAVVRGLDTSKYTAEENLIVYLGVSSYIGSQRGAQNRKRDMVTHITDAKEWSKVPQDKRHGIHTNSALPFHNDMGCEILALQYRQVAATGGATSVSSAAAIYEDLVSSHPDALEALTTADWPVQLTGSPARFARLPLLSRRDDNRVVISVDPGRLGLHPATAGLREGVSGCDLSSTQLEALRTLTILAEKHAVAVAARPGDMLYINNLAMLHKRDSYTDSEGGEADATRRHLVRLWLRNPELAGEVPEDMKAPWKAAYGSRDDAADGRFLEDQYQVVPSKEYEVPKYTSGSAAWLIECDEAE